MKAQSLWPGTDYAWRDYRPKGYIPIDAKRVKVLQIIKRPILGKTKSRTYAKIQLLNDDGTPNGQVREVVARDIIDFWDEYIESVGPRREEQERHRREAQERAKQRQREREEKDALYSVALFIQRSWRNEIEIRTKREAEERRKKEEARRIRMRNVMIGRGFKQNEFWIIENQVNIKIEEMERWLGFEETK